MLPLQPHRRRFLRLLTLLASLGPGWLAAAAARRRALPAAGPSFPVAGSLEQALAAALKGQGWQASDAVRLELPPLAENGAIVPVTVESRLPDTRRILIFAEKNPGPLLAEFQFAPGADAWVSLRLKLNDSGPVLAIAETGSGYFGTQTVVKVMVGGCG